MSTSQNEETAEHAAWEERLGLMGKGVNLWAKRITQPPVKMQQGSSLEADDRQFKQIRVSGAAWYAITTSVEHLDFTISGLRASGTVYPTAQLTVLRTALITGATAVWLLRGKTRNERQLRALNIEVDELNNRRAALNSLKIADPALSERLDEALASLKTRERELQALSDVLGGPKDISKWRLNTTTLVDQVATLLHKDEELLINGLNLFWRRGSAAAHGARSLVSPDVDASAVQTSVEGVMYSTTSGDLVRSVGPAAAAAFLTTAQAIEAYDLRRVRHT